MAAPLPRPFARPPSRRQRSQSRLQPPLLARLSRRRVHAAGCVQNVSRSQEMNQCHPYHHPRLSHTIHRRHPLPLLQQVGGVREKRKRRTPRLPYRRKIWSSPWTQTSIIWRVSFTTLYGTACGMATPAHPAALSTLRLIRAGSALMCRPRITTNLFKGRPRHRHQADRPPSSQIQIHSPPRRSRRSASYSLQCISLIRGRLARSSAPPFPRARRQ